jgi:putative transposase
VPADGERPPFRVEEAGHLSRATGRPYGLRRVCRIFGPARPTAYYLEAREAVPPERRPVPGNRGPVGAATDLDPVGHIRRALAESPSHGGGCRKVWARLRRRGVRTAAERVRRLMREHHLQAPRRGGNAHGPKAHGGTTTTAEPDVMWGTDTTTTVAAGRGAAHVLAAVDHCTRECVGLHAAKRGDRFGAMGPLRQGARVHFGGFEAEVARGPAVRHGHGGNHLSDDFRREPTPPGMRSSPSFVREPEGDGCAGRFIPTLEESHPWVRTFATAAELVEALREFKRAYDERWLIRRHGRRTPSQVRCEWVSSKTATNLIREYAGLAVPGGGHLVAGSGVMERPV